MENLIINLSGKVKRIESEGREYLVAPLRMIVPGVLNGSKGPILYEAEDIAESVPRWNKIPLTLNHPPGPAKEHEDTIIGDVRNAGTDGADLIGEGWFDVEKTRKVDNRIYDLLLSGKKVELSTGLGMDLEKVENSEYNFIARNYDPDHLAILPDDVGACSLEDGCGVLNANEARKMIENAESYKPTAGMVEEAKRGLAWRSEYGRGGTAVGIARARDIVNGKRLPIETVKRMHSFFARHAVDKKGKGFSPGEGYPSNGRIAWALWGGDAGASWAAKIAKRADNEAQQIWNLLAGQFKQNEPSAWIREVFNNHFVYERDGKTFKQNFNISDKDSVKFSGKPVEVRREVKLVPVKNSKEGNKMNEEQRKEVIDNLISNSCGCWSEDDREVMNQFSDDRLTSLKDNAEKTAKLEAVANAAKEGFTDESGKVHAVNGDGQWETAEPEEETVVNEAGSGMADQPKSVEEYLATLPPEMAAVYNQSKQIVDAKKEELVHKLVSGIKNEKVRNDKGDSLIKKSLEELQEIASLMPVENAQPVPEKKVNWGAAQGGSNSFTNNSSMEFGDDQVLTLPVMNFSNED